MNHAIGIDIGGTYIKFGIFERNGACIFQDVLKMQQFPKAEMFVKTISAILKKQIAECNIKESIKGIGIGAPNGNFFTGSIVDAPNLPWKNHVALAHMMEQELQLPVALTNDANAAAIGEMLYGGAKEMKNFIVLTLGTGLGSGIVSDGKILYGNTGFAGELGHVIVVPDGRPCGCGRKGCLEKYVSATGIVNTALELIAQNKIPSKLSDISANLLDARMIHEAALQEDALALKAFEITGHYLGFAIANAVAITSPQAVFLLGGLALSGKLLFEPTILSLEKNILNIFAGTVEVLPSELPPDRAALLGAAALVWMNGNGRK